MDTRIRLNNSIAAIPDQVILWISLVLGSAYLVFGISSLMEDVLSASVLYNTSFGLSIIAYGIIYYGYFFPWTPQITINEERVIIRPGLFAKTSILQWADVSEIKLGIRRVTFKIDGDYKDFKLSVSALVSKDVKQALREAATIKNLPFIGG
jgi:hypothetical protein